MSRMMGTTTGILKYKLNNGRCMPAIALGSYLGFGENGIIQSTDKQLRDIVSRAIETGYRHIDTASVYETEDEIGEAIRMKIDAGLIVRDDVFITTKLWVTQHRREQVPNALKNSLKKMELGFVDMYLMHWPISVNEDYTFNDVDYLETWRGMEDAQNLGLTKGIGVSNFNLTQLRRLLDEGTVKPAVLQIENHLQIIEQDLVRFAQDRGIIVMGYSPLGSLVPRYGMQLPGPKMDDPVLVEIARKYGKTVPQVVLRWLVDRGIVPVTKTVNVKRLSENIDIFDFSLTDDEIARMNAHDDNTRLTPPSFWQEHPHYPFEKTENPVQNPFRVRH